MIILSWNINGIRAAARHGFFDFLKSKKPDILCLQEIKITDAAREKVVFDFKDYAEFWHPAVRPGYSGTAIFVREGVEGKILPYLDWDNEGRIQVLELKNFYLVNVYFPNANRALSRLDFKLDFNQRLLKHLKKLEVKKPLVITGDYNVAHEEIDIARPKDNLGTAGFTVEERNWMTSFLAAGFIDTFRYFYKNKVQYTWWTYRFGARSRNVGWRIDYFCVSAKIIKLVKKAFIWDQITGSDHCPVGIEIKS